MFRYSLRGLLVLITVTGCGFGLYHQVTHFETAENVGRVDWLPRSASNISYYKSYNFTAYEFDIPEAEFLIWAARWKLLPISEPLKISRYCLKNNCPDFRNYDEWEQWDERGHVTIAVGWYFRRRWSGCGGEDVAYDRTVGRAYFQTNPR